MVVNPDGTGLQVLAQNFRNPYELAVDAFGDIWQTDNDDDGNAWTRANYVMAGGNYGFRGPRGRSWRRRRRHALSRGAARGCPQHAPPRAGVAVRPGGLRGHAAPRDVRGHLLHAEAGRRLLAHYPLVPDGAGYSTRIEEVVEGGEDTWFRPSDVAVAPDGSVYIADWYDPSVGGHGTGDPQGARGRIYRLAPPEAQAVGPHARLAIGRGVDGRLSRRRRSRCSTSRTPSSCAADRGPSGCFRRCRVGVTRFCARGPSGCWVGSVRPACARLKPRCSTPTRASASWAYASCSDQAPTRSRSRAPASRSLAPGAA